VCVAVSVAVCVAVCVAVNIYTPDLCKVSVIWCVCVRRRESACVRACAFEKRTVFKSQEMRECVMACVIGGSSGRQWERARE